VASGDQATAGRSEAGSGETEIALELEAHLEDRYRELRTEGLEDHEAARCAIEELQDDSRMRTELSPELRACRPRGRASSGIDPGRRTST
jgi:hypothetical protein